MDVVRTKDASDKGEIVPIPNDGWVFHPGEGISFRVTNNSKKGLDVTLLIIDPDCRIVLFYTRNPNDKKTLKLQESTSSPGPAR